MPKAAPGSSAGKIKTNARILVPIALILLAAVVVAVFVSWGGKLPFFEPKSQPYTLNFVTPNYNEDTDSKIPLQVKGKTTTGEEYDETFYVSPSQPQLEVPTGSYELSLPASPLMETGDIYTLPKPITLDTKSGDENSKDAPEIAFELKPSAEITKEDIDAAKAAAQASGFDVDRIDSLSKTVIRKQSAGLYGEILDNIANVNFTPEGETTGASQSYTYVLQDINADGMPDLLVSADMSSGQRYCAWVGSPDGSGVTQVAVPGDLATRYGHASSFQSLLSGSNKGNGLFLSYSSLSGAVIPTTTRYVVKDGALVADGEPIQSPDPRQLAPEVVAESVQLNFIDVSDRSALDAYAAGGKDAESPNGKQAPSPSQGQATESKADAISNAKAKGLVVLTGTVRVVTGDEALGLCEGLDVLSASDAKLIRQHANDIYASVLSKTYTLFVLDEPQEVAWMDSLGEMHSGKTYVVDLRNGLNSPDGQHVTVAFDNNKGHWPSEMNPLGGSPSCSSVEVLSVG
ncbi:hypothetical protein K6V98_01020 [Collinsella sp. AGMB00827]|uniref:Uncharacterized protein n=1 Tax=Collinsella ureilytica TaxID=2869515 RepID=A0ABS7MHX4_9ACTN|nr:hypothetical protein [Collinsella urealyticum]MBY4796950.1 hypothetical protein [Collinsella urealyticum]